MAQVRARSTAVAPFRHKWPLSSFAVGQVYCDSTMARTNQDMDDSDEVVPYYATAWFGLKDGPHPKVDDMVGILSLDPTLHVTAIGVLVEMAPYSEKVCRVYITDTHVRGAAHFAAGSVCPVMRKKVVSNYWKNTSNITVDEKAAPNTVDNK